MNNVLKQMSKDDVQALPDVAAKYGCTVRLAGQMSDPILVKLLLVAIELLEWYHSNIQSAAELWRKQARDAFNLLLLMHTFFVPTSDFQQIVAFILYTTVWLNLHHWSQSTASRTSWINRFKRFQVTRLTWPEFCKKKMLYVCLHVGIQTTQQLHFAGGYQYVGSTTQTIFQRRNARIRKLNQLHTDKLVKCELALRYWHSTKNFFEYVMMPWKAFSKDSQLHVQELLLIEKLQPKLNYPFISRLIFAAGKFPRASKVPPISSLQPHHKLRKKLRVRLRLNPGQWFLNTVPQKPSTAWQFIYDLASTTRNQLTAWRRLRSPEMNSTQLLFLVRLAATAEAHIKFKALHLLYKEMQRRNMAKPKNKRPLTIPFLAHSEFGYNLKKWLTDVIIQHKHRAVEFHVPSTKICCKSSQTVAEAVYNMKYFIRQWSMQPPTTCTCASFLEQYPTCRTTRGHVASAMSSLQLPGQLHQIVTFSANSQIYLGRQKYLKITQDLVQQWLRHHHLESIDIDLWQQFIHQEWPNHLTAAKFGVSWKHIKDIQQKTKGFVLHCIDHRPFEAWIFCPLLYHQLLMKTFQDQTTYTPLRVPPVGLPDFCSGLVPTTLLKRYPWGFRTKSFRVANAYILAKHKKDFTTARSIVAYHATIAAPILATTSWLLIDISKQVFSKAFGDRTVYQIWKQIHSAMDAPFQFQSHNDDLVGFFTSLPQQRILEDVQDMIQRYCRSNRLDIATAVMSVPSRTHKYHQPSIQGKVSFADQPMVKIQLKHVLDIVKMSFDLGIFHVAGLSFRQTHGTAIGNQISPVLSGISVSKIEHDWVCQHPTVLKHITVVRYVDNRYILVPVHILTEPDLLRDFQQLCDKDFYIPPVELEPVKDPEEFLGFKISLSARRISFILPLEKWQHRHPRSAGSQQNKLSAFNARAALIRAHGYPKTQIDQDLQALVKLFPESRGVPVTSSTRWKVSLDRPCSGVKFCP